MSINFQIREVYSFNVHPVAIIGDNFKNVTVLAVMDAETANQSIDIYGMHVQCYPYLPNGTPNRATDHQYVKIRLVSGETTILALPWIKEDTVAAVSSTVINVKIGNVTPSDVTRIRDALTQNGFTSLEVTVET